jgi:hypothetical protein
MAPPEPSKLLAEFSLNVEYSTVRLSLAEIAPPERHWAEFLRKSEFLIVRGPDEEMAPPESYDELSCSVEFSTIRVPAE